MPERKNRTAVDRFARHVAALSASVVLATAAAFGDLPSAPSDGIDEATFAREVIPLLLGRGAHGVAEIALIADVSQKFGREAATRMLMQQEEYVSHWTELVLDILEVQRGGLFDQAPACFGAPLRAADDGGELAAFVHSNPPGATVPGPPFNMIDLIRSAIVLDDLSPVYKAFLYPLAAKQGGVNSDSGRAFATDTFLRVYLNRNPGCLGCHNRTFSLSNRQDDQGNIAWRRLWSIPANIEKALFDNYNDSLGTRARLELIFRADVRTSSYNAGSMVPWGMINECNSDSFQTDAFWPVLPGNLPEQPTANFGSLDGAANPHLSVVDLERAFHNGTTVLATEGLVRSAPPPTTVTTPGQAAFCDFVSLTADSCVACHAPPQPAGGLDLTGDPGLATVNQPGTGLAAGQTLVVPGNANTSALYQLIANRTMPMFAAPLSPGDIALVQNWINIGAEFGSSEVCQTSQIPDVDPDPAFAFQVAVTATNGIWKQVMGVPLTIDHGFPRNDAQLQALWYLTEDVFLPGRWSLKDVLVQIVTSNYFVRKSPADGGAGPYTLPMLWDSWVEDDPTIPPPPATDGSTQNNGPGELTRRRSARGLVHAYTEALGWLPPQRSAGNNWLPTLENGVGRYGSVSQAGFEELDFQALLDWETELGNCSKTARTQSGMDWIDRLFLAIQAFDAQHPEAPITLAEAYLIMKDWLVADPTLSTQLPSGLANVAGALTEEQALLAFFNAELPPEAPIGLGAAVASMDIWMVATKLREACGVLLKSPQFMLANVTPASYSNALPQAPRLRVCNEEPCQPQTMCEQFRDDLGSIGQTAFCIDAQISDQPPADPQPIADEPAPPDEPTEEEAYLLALAERAKRTKALCPDPVCAFLPWKEVAICEKSPGFCRNPPVRPCDPRCTGPKCCGQLPRDIRIRGLLSLWADGSRVELAEGIGVARAGSERFSRLAKGTVLQTGDVIIIPPQGGLLVRDRNGVFGTLPPSEKSVPASVIRLEGPLLAAVTGPAAERNIKSRGVAGRIDPRVLRAPSNREFFQSRVALPGERQKIALRAARPSFRRAAHVPPDMTHVHVLWPPGAEPDAAPPKHRPAVDLRIRFDGRGRQAIYCPGSRPVICTPGCRLLLDAPMTCGVVGVVGPSQVSAKLEARSGSRTCTWSQGTLSCR